MVTAQKPYQPIEKGKAGPGLLAKIATDKFWLHLPLYRQEQVFEQLNIPINRSSMSRWLQGVGDLLDAIVQRMKTRILDSRVIQSDATTMPVIKKGLGKTHRAYIWVYRGDASQPYVCYDYSDTEHSLYPERILKGYKGILQTDGTNKFNGIIKEAPHLQIAGLMCIATSKMPGKTILLQPSFQWELSKASSTLSAWLRL